MTISLTTKERNLQRSSIISGFRLALLPMMQARLAVTPLEQLLQDPTLMSLIKQAEDATGYAIRLSVGSDGQLRWDQIDLTEDSLVSVQMSKRQAMRATLGGVELEITIAKRTDGGVESVERNEILYAINRLADILGKMPDPSLHIPSLEDGKRHTWDIHNLNGSADDEFGSSNETNDAPTESSNARETEKNSEATESGNMAETLHGNNALNAGQSESLASA